MKVSTALAALMLLTTGLSAQENPGLAISPYAGITGFALQPASIADSRFQADIQLFNVSFAAGSNWFGMKRSELFNPKFLNENFEYLRDYAIEVDQTDSRKGLYVNGSLGVLNTLVSFSPNFSAALTIRGRTMYNLDDLSRELSVLVLSELEEESLYNLKLNNDRFSINGMAWTEVGIGGAYAVGLESDHMFKFGGQVKFMQGLTGSYFYARKLDYSWKNSDTLSLFSSEFGYGHTTEFQLRPPNKLDYLSKVSLGLDAGVEWVYQPDREDRRDRPGYKLKLGASLLDLGRIKFSKDVKSNDFKADIRDWDVSNIEITGKNGVQNFDDTINKRFGLLAGDTFFNMSLPTALSLQADWNIDGKFYLGAVAYGSPRLLKLDENRVHSVDYISIIPHFETVWIGAALPLSIDNYGFTHAGLSLRLGPLLIGTQDWLTALRRVSNTYDFFVALKVPVPYNKNS